MEKEQLPRRRVGLWIFTIVIIVILTGTTIWFEKIKSSYNKDIDGTQKIYLALSQNATAMDETKHRRVEYFRNRFFADFPFRYSYGAADFMRRLSLVGVKGIEPVKLAITPHGQDLAFELNISVTAGNNIRAQEIFSRYYRAMKNFEDITEINYTATNPKTLITQGKVNLFFNIVGVTELE